MVTVDKTAYRNISPAEVVALFQRFYEEGFYTPLFQDYLPNADELKHLAEKQCECLLINSCNRAVRRGEEEILPLIATLQSHFNSTSLTIGESSCNRRMRMALDFLCLHQAVFGDVQ